MSSFTVSNYDLKHLRVFISIVENEGVSSAAVAAGATLSTISRDLAALETRLGMQLCRRGRGGFSLTLQGEKVYRAAKDLQSRLQLFEMEVKAAQDVVSKSFNIGIIDHIITSNGSGVVNAMAQMRQEFPETAIGVTVHEVGAVDVLVRERRLDVGVTAQPAWLQPIEYKPVFLEEHRLYVGSISPDFAGIHAAVSGGSDPDIAPLPYIARAQDTLEFKDFEDRYPHAVVSRCSNLEAVLAAVLSGVGCALMPRKFVEGLGRDDLVEVPFSGPPVCVQFYVAYRRDTAGQKDIRSFLSNYE